MGAFSKYTGAVKGNILLFGSAIAAVAIAVVALIIITWLFIEQIVFRGRINHADMDSEDIKNPNSIDNSRITDPLWIIWIILIGIALAATLPIAVLVSVPFVGELYMS